jgi:putative transposase
MPQSLTKNYIHIIFSTKQRQPLIPIRFENEIHSYLAGICDRLECYPIIAGGYTDHVHILCLLSKKIPLVKLVGELKAYSSKWIKTKD